MTAFKTFLVDSTTGPSFLRLSDSVKRGIKDTIDQYFRDVCNGTNFTMDCGFNLSGRPTPNDLVVYFLGTTNDSIIRREGGQQGEDHAGGTWLSSHGMISEVYVDRAGPTTRRIANVAFHELMHNKLDISPAHRRIQVHRSDRHSLANTHVTAEATLQRRDIRDMRRALTRQIAQYWQ